ncbi:hypothetical protein SLEP1_g22630 [Rubroshorea leprosula]|uniref:Uncharacterized protein n=1 Tax=Rubroshorea leprosula TaxID=152421 RepID=A0AAV5JCT2_9ROSI|nr:hypothetical protein SLEP1_g22630 [Rubroshorea leprosula]
MQDSKKHHAATSLRTLKQFCKLQNVTEMSTINEDQMTLRPESNPTRTFEGHESQLQRATQSQQCHAALEATSTSMPPSHSKPTKTNTSNSPLTPGRPKPTHVQTCHPSINEGPFDGRQQANAATQKPTLWPVSVHKSDKVSTSSISTSFETNKHVPFALLKKFVCLKRGVISSLEGQPIQIEQQRLQDLIVNEVHKATTKEAARFVSLQPDTNPNVQLMPPQQKHMCKPSPPQQFANSLHKATMLSNMS